MVRLIVDPDIGSGTQSVLAGGVLIDCEKAHACDSGIEIPSSGQSEADTVRWNG